MPGGTRAVAESGARNELKWAERRAVGVAPADLGACRAARRVGLAPRAVGGARSREGPGGMRWEGLLARALQGRGPGPLRSFCCVLASREPAGPTGKPPVYTCPRRRGAGGLHRSQRGPQAQTALLPAHLRPGRTDPSVPQRLTWHQASTK